MKVMTMMVMTKHYQDWYTLGRSIESDDDDGNDETLSRLVQAGQVNLHPPDYYLMMMMMMMMMMTMT